MFLQGQIGIPLFDLQGFYRVKPVSFLLFTRFLPGQNSLPFLIYNVFTGSNQSLFFRLTRFLRGPINVLIYMMFEDLRAIYKDDTVNMCKTFYKFLHCLLSITAEGRWL